MQVDAGSNLLLNWIARAAQRTPDKPWVVSADDGRTVSYGALAAQIGNSKAVRAVGLANGANPVSVVVPCHRVIGAAGSLTGYGGGLERKRWLLQHEGALAASELPL